MRKLLITLTVLVVVVGGLLLAADRVGASYAEDKIAEQVAANLASRNISSQPPEVTVTGFPFLTQVARGNYDEIRLDLRELRGGTLPLPLLEVRAFDVRATVDGLRNGTEKAVATRVTGLGTLSYADLVLASGLTGITLTGDGSQVRMSGDGGIAGELRGSAKVTAVDGKVRIEITELTAANLAPAAQQFIDSVRKALTRTITLPALPFNLKLMSVQPDAAGLRVGVAADEVVLG